ncbi:cobalamin biosynthesis protein CbiL [uncultured Mailhella sp.]|uniref:cobalamin biosynthesis protein CbiL n=1 Tax=uncultured Mailhella sp. TaxID=1981031 RepID=UPI00260FEE3E|nr:cobalamin biosynthesis protein CbiL [uncultured Mailhella sp.]
MIRRGLCAAALLLLALCLPEEGLAHRVTVFAWPQGTQVLGECAFSRGSPVRQGRILVQDAANGAPVLECRTDDQGRFQFPIPGTPVKAGHGLRITVMAGEGHQDSTELTAEELRGTAVPSLPAADSTHSAPAASPPAAPAQEVPGLTADQVREIVETALDSRLEPLYRRLAANEEAGPSLRDIVGGLGWILGLAGLAAYCRRRK